MVSAKVSRNQTTSNKFAQSINSCDSKKIVLDSPFFDDCGDSPMDTTSLETLQSSPLISDTLSILLGIALSAACGFRIFVPFLVVSLVGVLGGLPLPGGFEWLNTSQALILFAVASGIEIGAYYIP